MTELKWPHLPQPRDVGVIVENQVKRWAFNQQKRQPDAPPVAWPVITISRESGTQGAELGQRLAERLGFSCWDRALVTQIARLMRTDEATVAHQQQHTRSAIVDLLGLSVFQQQDLATDYSKQLRRIVDSISRRGNAVIVGRGSQFLVDPGNALRVRLVAPFEFRAQTVATRDAISSEAAKREVALTDGERIAFVRQSTGHDVTDPTNYDIVINAGLYAGERLDAVVLMAYLAKFGELPLTEAAPLVPSLPHTTKRAGER